MKQAELLAQTLRDLTDDAKIFTYIALDNRRKLIESQACNHQVAQKNVLENTSQYIELELRHIQDSINQFRHDIFRADTVSLPNLYEHKQQIIANLHYIAGIVGQTVTMSHWQSPSIDSAHIDNVGSLKGKILAHFNDYTRDMHVYGVEFEKEYRNQYIPIPHTIPVFTYATSSGMAAMTTAALFIQGEAPHDGNILLGTSCYFETKQLIKKLFGKRVYEVDLSDLELARDACVKHNPVAIFADTIGNEPSMREVEISNLIRVAASTTKNRIFIVCDPSANTLSASYVHGFSLPKNVTLLGVESQNKLLQFGLDRACAGVVWGTGYVSQKLYDYRDHAGTICPDSIIATLPTPNRAMAKLYTKRLVRNTKTLVSLLQNSKQAEAKKITVIYPAKSEGVYFILHWKQSLLHSYKRYINRSIAAAKKSNVQIVHGTSFGLNTTRIYTVAMHTQYTHAFLRIAVGSESISQIHSLGELLSKQL